MPGGVDKDTSMPSLCIRSSQSLRSNRNLLTADRLAKAAVIIGAEAPPGDRLAKAAVMIGAEGAAADRLAKAAVIIGAEAPAQ
ncbi:MAG: hypothetical protein WDW36_008043 [Sanguina aurantia]